jgi:hypothetical protein
LARNGDSHERRETGLDLAAVFGLREQPFGALAPAYRYGQDNERHAYADEDADRQAEPVEELPIVGYAHAVSMDLPGGIANEHDPRLDDATPSGDRRAARVQGPPARVVATRMG